MHASQAAQASAAPYAPYAPYEMLALLARNLLCNNCFNSRQCQHAVELPVILSVYLCIIRAMSIYFNEKVFFQSRCCPINSARRGLHMKDTRTVPLDKVREALIALWQAAATDAIAANAAGNDNRWVFAKARMMAINDAEHAIDIVDIQCNTVSA